MYGERKKKTYIFKVNFNDRGITVIIEGYTCAGHYIALTIAINCLLFTYYCSDLHPHKKNIYLSWRGDGVVMVCVRDSHCL